MSDEQLSVTVVDRGSDTLISVSGELDFGTTAGFLEVTQPLVEAGQSGLGALVRLHKLADGAGGSLCLARLRPQLESTIRLTMLHRLFRIRDDVPAVDDSA